MTTPTPKRGWKPVRRPPRVKKTERIWIIIASSIKFKMCTSTYKPFCVPQPASRPTFFGFCFPGGCRQMFIIKIKILLSFFFIPSVRCARFRMILRMILIRPFTVVISHPPSSPRHGSFHSPQLPLHSDGDFFAPFSDRLSGFVL